MNDINVGQNPLPTFAQVLLADLITQLGERYQFNRGETAAFWSISMVLAQHLGEGKQ